jgi:serine protease Do
MSHHAGRSQRHFRTPTRHEEVISMPSLPRFPFRPLPQAARFLTLVFPAFWMVVAALFLPAETLGEPRGASPTMTTLSRSLEDLSARISPAIVQIRATAYGPADDADSPESLTSRERRGGSGVLLTPDGYIVTNAHVVEGARQLRAIVPVPGSLRLDASIVKPTGKRVPATLIGLDRETDLALLKIDMQGLPAVKLGDSDLLRPGQIVLAFGSPLGLDNTVTMGVVSAVGRQLKPEDRMVYIQTDASINPGNSGGALVNADGEVVGINTLIYSQSGGNEGISFAAPSNIVRHVVDEIRQHGRVRRGESGIYAQTITPLLASGLNLRRDRGVILGDVDPDGPAAFSGLLVGDIVLRINGKPVENGRQLDVNLYRAPVGEPVTLDVVRGAGELSISVPVGERPDNPERFSDLVDPDKNRIDRLGVLGVEVDASLQGLIPWSRKSGGVLVAARAADSPAAGEGGLVAGDIIQSVNGIEVTTLEDLKAAAAARKPGDSVVLQVNRRGRLMYLAFEME